MQLNDKKQKLNCTTQGYPRFLVVVQGMWLYDQKKTSTDTFLPASLTIWD